MYISVTIEGSSPLICNRFTDEAALAATNGTRTTKKSNDELPEEICRKKLYTDENGVVGMPTMNVLASIRDAGKFFKAGKRQLTTGESSMIPAFVLPTQIFVPLVHKQKWAVDARAIVNPATKGRKLGYRPIFFDWRLTLELDFAPVEFDAKLLRQVVDVAGQRVGLGDFRPSRRGPFGRYLVTNWVETDESTVALPVGVGGK